MVFKKPDRKCLETAAVLIAFGLLIVNNFQAYATQKAAAAAVSAAKTAQETLVRTQRAWVGMKGYFLPHVSANVKLTARFSQINVGHAPAFSVGDRVAFGVLEQELTAEQAEIRLATAKPPNTYTLFPSQEAPAGQATLTISDYWLGQVNDGKAWLYYFGDMTYTDEFRGKHRTIFCAVYNPTIKEFQHCDVFNDAN